jgi:hypothetical protein
VRVDLALQFAYHRALVIGEQALVTQSRPAPWSRSAYSL